MGSSRGRTLGIVAIVLVALVGVTAIAWGLVGNNQPNKSVIVSPPSLVPSSPSASPGEAPQTSQPQAEPVVTECVGPFMPEAFDVLTPNGRLNPERVVIAPGTISAMGGVNPPIQPAVVLGSLTSLPGSDKGSTMIALHSQINPPLVGNFLSEMTQADVDSGSRIVLYGPGNCQAAYQVGTLSTDIDKGSLGHRYVDGPAGTLVILTCNLDLPRQMDTTKYRILVGTRISSVASS